MRAASITHLHKTPFLARAQEKGSHSNPKITMNNYIKAPEELLFFDDSLTLLPNKRRETENKKKYNKKTRKNLHI